MTIPDERQEALDAVAKASEDMKLARERYAAALLRCASLKIPYAAIARAVHKTEAAVRMFIARNERKGA